LPFFAGFAAFITVKGNCARVPRKRIPTLEVGTIYQNNNSNFSQSKVIQKIYNQLKKITVNQENSIAR
jgi:hypothetical protein